MQNYKMRRNYKNIEEYMLWYAGQTDENKWNISLPAVNHNDAG